MAVGVLCLFIKVALVGLQCVFVVCNGHTYFLVYNNICSFYLNDY